jgi:alginate O-acetyltransferase complex protein AlgI
MMTEPLLARLIFIGGLVHFSILVASSLVPFQLNWREDLKSLPRLHRQMYWTYGGYVVLSIIAFGCISLTSAAELAHRTPLARGFCLYVFIFWAIRLALQAVFDVKEHLTAWWLKLGYGALTVLFAYLAATYGWAAMGPVH